MDNDLFGVFFLYGIGEIDHSDDCWLRVFFLLVCKSLVVNGGMM